MQKLQHPARNTRDQQASKCFEGVDVQEEDRLIWRKTDLSKFEDWQKGGCQEETN